MNEPTESRLLRAINDAIERQDGDAFKSLLVRHHAEIVAEFSSWLKVPASVRADQQATSRYIESVMTIARAFASVGEPGLLEQLTGPADTNPILQWRRRVAHAQALSKAGEYPASNLELEQVLADMDGATGSAIVNLRPKLLGLLGFNAQNQGDFAGAMSYMKKAYAEAIAAQDEDGEITYYDNLVSLAAIEMLTARPTDGEGLLAVRGLVARAQDLSDAGRYEASNRKLSQALELVRGEQDEPAFGVLLPKIHGLLGFNEFKRGYAEKARAQTVAALEESNKLRDRDGIRIYSANLAGIDKAAEVAPATTG